jgi:hypothetical protein
VKPAATRAGADQRAPFLRTASPRASTATQKVMSTHDTAVSALSSIRSSADHHDPFQRSAWPVSSTATQKSALGHDTPVRPLAAMRSGADHFAPFQRSESPLPSTATALNDGPFSALRLVYADDRAHRSQSSGARREPAGCDRVIESRQHSPSHGAAYAGATTPAGDRPRVAGRRRDHGAVRA